MTIITNILLFLARFILRLRFLRFKLEHPMRVPKYESEKAVGIDVTAQKILKVYEGQNEITGEKFQELQQRFEDYGEIKISPLSRVLFGTGIKAQLPYDIELQVRSRSGLALKRGLFVGNQPGTIDPDYQGEIGIILYNSTLMFNAVDKGERIAQLVPKKVIHPIIKLLNTKTFKTTTIRGEGGFGSTGNK